MAVFPSSSPPGHSMGSTEVTPASIKIKAFCFTDSLGYLGAHSRHTAPARRAASAPGERGDPIVGHERGVQQEDVDPLLCAVVLYEVIKRRLVLEQRATLCGDTRSAAVKALFASGIERAAVNRSRTNARATTDGAASWPTCDSCRRSSYFQMLIQNRHSQYSIHNCLWFEPD